MMRFLNKQFGLIVVLLLSTFSVLPFFNSGFFSVHDDTQVQRVFEMGKAIKDGMLPVRWVSDLGYGYGYPIFNFYAPLSYYVGGFFNVLGFDAVLATKMMIGLGIIFAGIFMYALAREFFGEIGGIIAGLFYLYAPYHAVDIFVRGDVAEFWGYAFIPLAFLGFYKLFKITKTSNSQLNGEVWKWIFIGSVGYAGVILSHNLTAMMITPFLLILLAISFYLSIRQKQFSIFNFQLSTLILGILVSAFYWLPALTEMKYTNVMSQIGGGADFRNHFVCISQLWNSQWGFGGSTKGCIDGMSFKVGKLHALLPMISLILLVLSLLQSKLFTRAKDAFFYKINIYTILLSILGVFVSIFFMLDISKLVWETIPEMPFFQYPWRFLILATFFLSFLSGAFFWYLQEINSHHKWLRYSNYLLSIIVVLTLLVLNLKLFAPQAFIIENPDYFINESKINWETSKISDEYLPAGFIKPKNENEVNNQKLLVKSGVSGIILNSEKTQSYLYTLNVLQKSDFLLKIAPYPAWQAKLNNKPFVLNASNKGYVFSLLPGKYELNVSFKQTMVQMIGNILSISGLAMLIIGIIYFKRVSYAEKKR